MEDGDGAAAGEVAGDEVDDMTTVVMMREEVRMGYRRRMTGIQAAGPCIQRAVGTRCRRRGLAGMQRTGRSGVAPLLFSSS